MPPTTQSLPETPPDFSHVRAWLFDLDNTLYPARINLFSQIEGRMNAYIRLRLGVDASVANAIRATYFREHGTTLAGLMRVNQIDAEDFLSFVHDIDFAAIPHDAALAPALERLPGQRFVFTNGCANYAMRVLERLGIAHVFHGIWDIRTMRFSPKPSEAAYEHVIAEGGFAPNQAAMFEDIARNLVPAHARGMTTVWLRDKTVDTGTGPRLPVVEPHHIHYETEDLVPFLQSLQLADQP
jgi:putative hydrolase of the HAD superfamily